MVFVWSRLSNGDLLFTLSQVALNDGIMLFAFAPIVGFLLDISAITVPWDILKSRGYRWDGEKKCWHTTVTGDEAIKDEAGWLKCNVYGGQKAKIEIEVKNCLTRFSNRIGNRVLKEI